MNETDLQAEIERLRQRVTELEACERALADSRAEVEALRASEAELRAIFTAMHDLVLVMDGEGRYLKIAATAPDLLYKPSDELVGKRMHEIMPPEAADFFLLHIRRALDTQKLVTMDYSLPIQDELIWFSANLSPMPDGRVLVVCRDVTERKKLEQVLQESLNQRKAMMEMATPLIPISDEVVIMPLVGQLDEHRVSQITETLLTGIQARRARVAILDITGVASIDASVSSALVRTARAVQLLGARVILTGIRPDVAQALVALSSDLTGIVTRGTLQSGIAFAMQAVLASR